jgi:hypothetical protein
MRILFGGLLFHRLLTGFAQDANPAPLSHPLMHFTPAQRHQMMLNRLRAPQMAAPKGAETGFAGSLSLLARLPYVPAERDQGGCGDCWQWAGTGVMEIAHDVQNGVHDRLSVQFINSCQTVLNCCEGGSLWDFATFYASEGFAIPWANNNAQFASASGSCANAPCGTIVTTPRYDITSISPVSIATHGVGQAQAIANIKSALNQNNAVQFNFYMATDTDWNQFFAFWDNQPESSVWSTFYCGQAVTTSGGGHAVLCVGYNDDDPNNRYWIMVNSWGTTTGRPNGIFLLSMDLDYDCADSSGDYNLDWETLNLQFAASGLQAPVLNSEPAVTPGTANTISWSAVQGAVAEAGQLLTAASSPEEQSASWAVNQTAVTASPAVAFTDDSLLKASVSASPARPGAPATPVATSQLVTSGMDTLPPSPIQASPPPAIVAPISEGEIVVHPRGGELPAETADRSIGPVEATLASSASVWRSPALPVQTDGRPSDTAWNTVLSDGFESGFPGATWQVSASPSWGRTTYGSHSGAYSVWCAGSSLSAGGGYADNMNAWMVYGPFSLADATSANLSFYFSDYSELNYDFFDWAASTDGTNFYGTRVSGDYSAWQQQTFDLTSVYSLGNLCGQSQVWIAFIFTSDSSIHSYPGALVDDVVLQKYTSGQPDLTPYQPSNWNDTIPIGTTQLNGTNAHAYNGTFYDNQTVYFNWASINQGSADAGGYRVHLEVTGTGGNSWDADLSSDPVNQYWLWTQDQPVGPLAAGPHTFKMTVDSLSQVAESNENNNYYERTITVTTAVTEYYAECATDSGFSSKVNSGWITDTQVTFTNLTPGQTYWYHVKARRSGVESDWSNVVWSQQDQSPAIAVTPTSQDFGSVQVGVSADRAFTVQNTGGGTLSGSASVPSPFSIVSGSPYSLTANQTTTVTVRYTPAAAGASDSATVTFTGGGGAAVSVTGTSPAAATVSATQACAAGYPTAGGLVTINCTFSYTNQTLLSLLWHPNLPDGFVLTNLVSGDGGPELQGSDIVFIGSLASNPIHFSYSLVASPVPTGQTATNKPVGGDVQYQFSSMVNPASVRGTPDPLLVPPTQSYHSADYRDPRWVIDGTEINRVLAYWRAGGYHVDAAGLDGYGAGAGSTNGVRHSADYRDLPWVIDGTEVNRVLSYWRAGGYHVDPSGLDGYAPGSASGAAHQLASRAKVGQPLRVFHAGPAAYGPGATFQVTNRIETAEPLVALLVRPRLPAGWQLVSVGGDGEMETVNGETVWMGDIPSGSIQFIYTVRVPERVGGGQQVASEVEYQTSAMSNPASVWSVPQTPGGLRVEDVRRADDGSVTISLASPTAEGSDVQASSDLKNWVPLRKLSDENGVATFVDLDASNHAYRFYRLKPAL